MPKILAPEDRKDVLKNFYITSGMDRTIEARASQLGISQSEYLRELVRQDLAFAALEGGEDA